jgi:hypothetical protein
MVFVLGFMTRISPLTADADVDASAGVTEAGMIAVAALAAAIPVWAGSVGCLAVAGRSAASAPVDLVAAEPECSVAAARAAAMYALRF